MLVSNSKDYLDETVKFMQFFEESPYTPFKTDPSYFLWKIVKNPILPGYIYLEKYENEVIGLLTITPKLIVVFGEILRAVEVGEALTHPDHRRRGFFVKAVKNITDYTLSQNISLLYGTPNRFSLAGSKKAGYADYPYSHIVQLTKYLVGFKQLIAFCKPQIGGRRQALLKFSESLKKQVFRPASSLYKSDLQIATENFEDLDDNLDGFWGQSRKNIGFFTLRDKSYLNWRFSLSPDKYKLFTAKRKHQVVGYIVTKITDNHGTKVGTICDYVAMNDSPNVFLNLLKHSQEYFKNEGVQFTRIWCFKHSPYFVPLASYGYSTDYERPVAIYTQSEAGKKILVNNAEWHFTIADCDHI